MAAVVAAGRAVDTGFSSVVVMRGGPFADMRMKGPGRDRGGEITSRTTGRKDRRERSRTGLEKQCDEAGSLTGKDGRISVVKVNRYRSLKERRTHVPIAM